MNLRPSELACLQKIADGLSQAEAAVALGVTPSTFRNSLHNARQRNEIGSTAAMVARAIREGILSPQIQPLDGGSSPHPPPDKPMTIRSLNRKYWSDEVGRVKFNLGRCMAAGRETVSVPVAALQVLLAAWDGQQINSKALEHRIVAYDAAKRRRRKRDTSARLTDGVAHEPGDLQP